MKLTSILIILLFAFTLAACGGGGSSGPAATDGMDPDGMDDDMAMMCPEGHTGTYPNCVDPAAEAAADKAEAELIAAAIGPGDRNVADLNTSTGDIEMPFTVDGKKLTGDDAGTADDKDDDYTKSDTAPAGISGWTGAMYERTTREDNDATTNVNELIIDRVVSYTDQADPSAQAYSKYFSTEGAGDRDAVEEASAIGILSIDEAGVAGNHELFTGDFGITGPFQTIPAPSDDPATAQDEETVTVNGAFYGISGSFVCESGCTRTSDKDGNLSALGGEWTFTPNGVSDTGKTEQENQAFIATLVVAGVVPDTDYMNFGYWLRETVGKDGTEYAMSPFHRGARNYGNVTTVVGTATYEGDATGLYMKKTLTSEGDVTGPFESGQFTADVMLNASFSGNDVSVNDQFSISGSVSAFMDASGNEINENWELLLNTGNAAGTAQDNMDESVGTFMGTTAGKNLAGDPGVWEGTFYGSNLGVDENNAETTGVVLPSSAAGTFDGHFTNGHVRGAFGATKQAE